MSTAGDLLNVVGLGTGIALYAMLLVMVVRAPRRAGASAVHDRLPLTTALLGLTWNLCELPLYLLGSAGILRPLPYLAFIGFSALGFLPAVVVHSALRTGNRGRPVRAGLITIAYGTSALAVVLHGAALVTGGGVPSVAAMRLLTYTFIALVVPAAFVTRQQPGGRRALSIAALAAFAVSALHLTQLHTGDDSWVVELLGHHASLPLALAILYQEYRFAFADLFLKRALTMVVLVAAAFVALTTLNPPSTAAARSALTGSRDVGLLVTLWVITALAYPRLHAGIAWLVDRVILDRPDYREIRRAVTRRLADHDATEPLLDDMCRLIAPALGRGVPHWCVLSTVTAAPDGVIVSVTAGGATILVPTADAPQYAIEGTRLTDGRRLLSDDIATLEIIAVAVARRIDAIRLTHERWDRELREEEMSKLATEAELRALRAQINPHFLFNALTTIGYLIQTAPPRALNTLMRLTALLRAVLKSEGDLTTLGHELDLIEAYLDIERARFEDRLDVRIAVPPALRSARLPPLLLQPLVENAIKHGVAPQRDGGRIVVSASLEGADELRVSVRDTGAGASDAALEQGRQRGVGLRNVERRLAAQYGSAASLTLESMPGLGMNVELRLPVLVWTEAAGIAP